MVFESLVVELINRYLGDFVENLDTSQLKLGIWGGDVVLNQLHLKESALDDLDLPVKVKAGHIGKLVLKIPWKNLYKEPVIAELDGIYALAVPNVGIKYNAEKEEKAMQDAKQSKLAKIEEAKKLAAEKDKPKEEKADTFAEKLVTQIIKNLQVKISNIHVRYEDRYSNPKRPFAVGVTLQELLFQTTDENWKPCVIKDAVTQIYKLVKLDSLSVYWNSCAQLLDGLERDQILDELEVFKCMPAGSDLDDETLVKNIASQGTRTEYQYVVRPISSVAHLRLNTKPQQTNFTIPKIGLTVVFDEIGVGLTKDQYDDILEMMESMERMNLLSLYRKYRPDLPLPGNATSWWHYAYTSVLEETVRRRRRMWSWQHISKHRLTMKQYREVYIQKLDSKKVSADVQKKIDEYEKYLDVFCITLMRQQAEVEAAKLGAKRKEEKSKGWFGGWWGGSKKEDKAKKGGDAQEIQDKFYELYTPEEKAKLYSAIGYEENEADLTLPVEYVAVKVVTKLRNVAIFLRDTRQRESQLLKLQLKDVYSAFGQRPAANAIQLEAKVDRMVVSGMPQGDFIPKMIMSQTTEKDQVFSLFNVSVETNPMDGSCDTRVKLKSRPLEIIYDAQTVNRLGAFFTPPESVQLKQFSQAAMAQFEEMKEMSTTGMQHAIEQHKYTDISVDLASSYVIVPQGGQLNGERHMLVLDLGHLSVDSEKHTDEGDTKSETLEVKMAKAYDKFNIKLQHIQLLFVHPGENWQAARQAGQSSMHILNPISILLDLGKCIFDKDPRMAKMRVSGVLPSISVSISDVRLKEILNLVNSIPFPEKPPAVEEPEEEELLKRPSTLPTVGVESTTFISKQVAVVSAEMQEGDRKPALQKSKSMEVVNFTDMELKFEINEVLLAVSQADAPFLKVVVERIGTDVKMRTFDMTANAYLGSVYVQHLKYKLSDNVSRQLVSVGVTGGPLINLVNTPTSPDSDQHLLAVTFVQANKKAPEFASMYNNTEQSIEVNFSALELLLHQGAILSLLEFAQNIAPPPEQKVVRDAASTLAVPSSQTARTSQMTSLTPSPQKEKPEVEKKEPRRRHVKEEDLKIINMKVKAVLHQFSVGICNDEKLITDVQIKGIEANVAMMKCKMTVAALLRDMTILDPDPKTAYPKILQIEGSEVLKADVAIYEGATEGEKYSDMSAVDMNVGVEIGCIKIVFVNKYVTDLLGFVDNFQAAKDKITEASQQAAQAGMEAVQSLQETASRLGLQVQMKAPVIVVPQNSTSLNTLLLDLGHLSVGNKFILAGKKSPSGVPAVLEEMKVVLTSTKLSRAQLKKDGGIAAECVLLEPITIALAMTRNLSAAWYHDKPDIDLSGALEPLTLRLSQGDFKTIMQVLDENMTEGQPATPPSAAAAPTTEASDKDKQGEPVKSETAEVTPKPAETTEKWVSIKVDFQIKGIHAFFYIGDSVLTSGPSGHNILHCLGKFELQVIAVMAKIMSDKAIEARVSLQDTILDDLRPAKRNGITRMIERSKGTGAKSRSMIAVDFKMDAEQNQNIKLDVSSLYICVCVEFLMTLADFFTKGLPEAKKPEIEPAKDAGRTKSSTSVTAAQKAPASTGSMDVVLAMEKPEIILIEDQMNHKTNALVVDMEMSFRMRQTPDVQSMNAGLTGLQIFSCAFDKRHQHTTQVLMPCDISLISSAPGGINPHMDISISDIVLNITPATIRTMTAVSAGLSVAPPEAETKSKREPVPSDLWQVRRLKNCSFWFLKLVKDDALELEVDKPVIVDTEQAAKERGEELMLGLPSLVVKLEGGIGYRTIPLLIVEASFQAQVRNWSSTLSVDGSLDLEVAYYNEKLAVWEPLIEPVVDEGRVRRWQLLLDVKMAGDNAVEDLGAEEDAPVLLPSKMVVNVSSHDALQMCMTKGCLEVLTNLGKAFNDAYNLVEMEGKKEEALSPFLFQNHTGFDILLKLDPSFEPPASASQGRTKLASGESLSVYNKKEAAGATKASIIKATQEGDERKIIFQMEQFGATREVTIKRAEKRLFQINQRSHQGDVWSVVCVTDCKIGQKIIYLRSIVMVKNNLSFPVEVLYRGDTKLESCGVAEPGGVLCIPLKAVYSLSSELFFQPVGAKYKASQKALNWRSAENTGLQEICCPSTQQGHSACYFNVKAEMENVHFEAGEEMTAKSYTLHLEPTLILHNLLPFTINYLLEGTSEQESLAKGENRPLTHASVNESTLEIIIPSYQGLEWVGRRKLQKNSPELTVWEFTAQKGTQKRSLELGLHSKANRGTMDVSLFAPYWMLNKTGCKLAYRGSDQDMPIEHPPESSELILFSFLGKSLFGGKKKESDHGNTDKKSKDKVREMKQTGKAQLRINDLDWSDKFSLDVVGSSGTVQCKSKGQTAEVGVSIALSSAGLTKIVTFTPFYMFLNTAEDTILVTEVDKESWTEIPAGQCIPFWPQQTGKEITVKVKYQGTSEVTAPFHINKAHDTFLRLSNDYGGILAECAVSERSMITTLKPYRPGYAAVLLVNHTDKHSVTFHQSGQQKTQTVGPQEAVLYAWDDALGKRELAWTCGKKKEVKTELLQDGMEEFFADSDSKVYWVSFLDGLQRVLMFTEDIAVAASAQEAGELEQVEQEINLEMQGLGVSLVDNYLQCEVAFLGITSSGIIWEEKKKRRFKALKLKDCMILETAWQKYQNDLAIGKTPPAHYTLENKMEVDFTSMTMSKPRNCEIRRSFQNGIWVQYKTSPHQLQLHAKINRVQLDNQLSHAVFPTVLSPLPPPKSVAAESVPKPFTEVSVMVRFHEHSNVQQIKYFKVLIQEMRLSVDQGFLNAILELFSANEPLPREQETIQFNQDLVTTEKSLMEYAGLSVAEEQKNFYDYLHFSPIKVHLSFSLQTGTGSSDGKPVEIQAGVINVFLQSVGVVLTDVQDVVFKLGYFERSHTFYNQSQLVGQMTSHYAGQAIKQMYVLVLGLDVLGNPFGLLRGLSEGIEDLFYEPYQGAIQGPEEFAEGLALGVRSLFGHAVGGAAGAVSRITGTLGKGLATLTLDDEYQKKRREQLNKRPATAREGFARGGKGLVMGVFDGVTGIVRKPVEGAKQEGVSGFFKGVGKGLVGVVTRPTSGVVDFASSSFEGIRRIAEVQEEIRRLRPPRRFFKDKVIRPYNHQEAEGYAILQETEKGKYVTTDEYQAHVVVSKDGKTIFIVTDKRVMLAKRGEIFGSWDCEWTYVWTELKEVPKKTAKGIEIILKEKEKKKLFGSSSTKKDVIIIDQKLSEWILTKIEEQMARYK